MGSEPVEPFLPYIRSWTSESQYWPFQEKKFCSSDLFLFVVRLITESACAKFELFFDLIRSRDKNCLQRLRWLGLNLEAKKVFAFILSKFGSQSNFDDSILRSKSSGYWARIHSKFKALK